MFRKNNQNPDEVQRPESCVQALCLNRRTSGEKGGCVTGGWRVGAKQMC